MIKLGPGEVVKQIGAQSGSGATGSVKLGAAPVQIVSNRTVSELLSTL